MKKYLVCWIDLEGTFAEEEAILTTGTKGNRKIILFDNKVKAEILAKALTHKKGINHYVSEFNENEFNPECEYLVIG